MFPKSSMPRTPIFQGFVDFSGREFLCQQGFRGVAGFQRQATVSIGLKMSRE